MENKSLKKVTQHETDIILVGAGLVGLSAAIAFAQQGKRVMLIDANKAPATKPNIKKTKAWDTRIYALTPATVDWLSALGAWQYMNEARVNDINAMQLWGADQTPLVLKDTDANVPKLGVIAENNHLIDALRAKLDALAVPMLVGVTCKKIEHTPTQIHLTLENNTQIKAKLLVAADGVDSFVRRALNVATNVKDYAQTAIVANFLAEKPHQNVARQWFSPHETLALLPLPAQHVSIVWAMSTERVLQLLKLTAEEFAVRVTEKSNSVPNGSIGTLKPVGEVLSFALKQMTAAHLIAERVAFVGDAAHQIHPMAGQGVNLGFRDVIALQALLAHAHSLQDIGENTFLRQYERARKGDIASMNGLTSGLDYLFAAENSVVKKLSEWGMQQLNNQLFVKKVIIKQAVA